jgi:hypothetical protein
VEAWAGQLIAQPGSPLTPMWPWSFRRLWQTRHTLSSRLSGIQPDTPDGVLLTQAPSVRDCLIAD